MPSRLIRLNPSVTPQKHYETNQDQLDIVPDGTGLQIIFRVKDQSYIIAGPRGGSVITVNGGKVENKHASYATQIAEEFKEETFGVMNILSTEKGYVLKLQDGSEHQLSMQDNATFLQHTPGKYAYVTFTAICNSLSLEKLKEIAVALTPTASFWNKIGDYLYAQSRKASEVGNFSEYWASQQTERKALVDKLVIEYNQLTANKALLVDPTDIFQEKTIQDALNHLNAIGSLDALRKMGGHTVGRYSERSGYHVFKTSELQRAADPKCTDPRVTDIHNNTVATRGIFNDDAVTATFPTVDAADKQEATSVGRIDFLTQLADQNRAAKESADVINPLSLN